MVADTVTYIRRCVSSIRSLIFPAGCMVCGEAVDDTMHGICPSCRYSIPLTGYTKSDNNLIMERFEGLIPLEHASAMFFFAGGSLWRTLIHRFKYGNIWRAAYTMGRWYGSELRESGLYDDVDVIVPVPLHFIKIMRRGYNQSTYLAEGMSREMHLPFDTCSVRRAKNNPPQARTHHSERWDNVEGIFEVRNVERLRGKHILLVDDMLTTGATIASCARAILDAVPDCRISIATLAVSQNIIKV